MCRLPLAIRRQAPAQDGAIMGRYNALLSNAIKTSYGP